MRHDPAAPAISSSSSSSSASLRLHNASPSADRLMLMLLLLLVVPLRSVTVNPGRFGRLLPPLHPLSHQHHQHHHHHQHHPPRFFFFFFFLVGCEFRSFKKEKKSGFTKTEKRGSSSTGVPRGCAPPPPATGFSVGWGGVGWVVWLCGGITVSAPPAASAAAVCALRK